MKKICMKLWIQQTEAEKKEHNEEEEKQRNQLESMFNLWQKVCSNQIHVTVSDDAGLKAGWEVGTEQKNSQSNLISLYLNSNARW